MLLLTVQSKEVIDEIYKNGVYYADINKSYYYKKTPNCYKELMNRISGNCPIFTWYKLEGKQVGIDEEFIKAGGMKAVNEGVWLLLDVPDNQVLLTDFYEYTDMMFLETEGPDDFKDLPTWEAVFNYVDKSYDIQAIIPCIKKEWIVKHKED